MEKKTPLEEYRDNKFSFESGNYPSHDSNMNARREGFDAAIALNLPVKFAEWSRKNCTRRWTRTSVFVGYFLNDKEGFSTEEELYQYWIENVYKP